MGEGVEGLKVHLSELPHEGPVDAHELLRRDAVGLVQEHPHLRRAPAYMTNGCVTNGYVANGCVTNGFVQTYLVLVRPEEVEDLAELIADVQFVRVEDDHDHVRAVREPVHHLERRGGGETMDSYIEDVVYLGRDVCHSPRDPPNDFRGYDYRLSHYARPFCQVTISLFDISGVARIIGLQIEVMNEKQACMGVMINDHGKICA